MTQTIEKKTTTREGYNWTLISRIALLAIVVVGAIGFVIYNFAEGYFTHGITRAGDYYKIDSLQRMSSFEFDPNNGVLEDVPLAWRNLDGKKVIVDGEIYSPNYAGRYLSHFDLVYSISKCCFQGQVKVQHFVHSRATSQVEYYPNLVRVKGTLRVKVTRDADKVTGVYWLDVDEIEPL